MLSEQKLQAYRRMTPEERWIEVEELMTLAWRELRDLPDAERRRRLDLVREDADRSDRLLLERLRSLR